MQTPPIPATLRTTRLLLQPWTPADASALHPILVANQAHLGAWIPSHVSKAVPLPELAIRLAGFATDFAAARSYRYALRTADDMALCGEVALFPRAATGRVPLWAADHVELGYWLDAAVTGRGLATEAAGALLEVAATLPGMTHAEIRCDVANAPSAAVPQRLGFELSSIEADLQVWRRHLPDKPGR